MYWVMGIYVAMSVVIIIFLIWALGKSNQQYALLETKYYSNISELTSVITKLEGLQQKLDATSLTEVPAHKVAQSNMWC